MLCVMDTPLNKRGRADDTIISMSIRQVANFREILYQRAVILWHYVTLPEKSK